MKTGCDVYGREIVPLFSHLGFSRQIQLIQSDIITGFMNEYAILVADSYGAYLLLHALAELVPHPGRILMFSPVLGEGISSQRNFGVRPPRSKQLMRLVSEMKYPVPGKLEIHTGADDNGCDPKLAEYFFSFIKNADLHIIQGQGHRLSPAYIECVVNNFI